MKSGTLEAGTTLGPYEIVAPLGAGGMGEVYRARDPRLERDIALKVLLGGVDDDSERLERFEREAKALAALNHPNIVTVYSVEKAGEIRFLTMELVEGVTLGKLIPGNGMPLARFFEVSIPLAEALAAAHAHGIVHRDLKPANVMVTGEGRVKVLDFGLAKRTVGPEEGSADELSTKTLEELTRTGQMMGTVPYMAPEQLRGRRATPRTDIFSLGAILYEMATGQQPFTAETSAELVSAILRDRPSSVLRVREDLPPRLEQAVARCLEKEPERRLRNALGLRDELEEIRQEWAERRETAASGSGSSERPSIAVLPFVNLNRDEESQFFADGLTEEILNALTRVEGLRVASRTSVFRYQDDPADIREIAGELQVATVLEGSVRRLGDRIRVTAQLIEAEDGLHRWSRRYDRYLEDIFEVQDDVARSVADELEGALTAGTERLVDRPTESPEAYDLYLKGRYQWERMTPEGFQAAIRYFEEAISADPEFAQPQAWLAVTYQYLTLFGHVSPAQLVSEGRAQMEKALDLDSELAEGYEAQGLYLQYSDWDWERAEEAYRRAMELRPGDVTVQAWYAIFLARFPGRQDEAVTAVGRALEMDPVSFEAVTFDLYIAVHTRRPHEALDAAERVLELYPGVPLARWAVGLVFVDTDRLERAVEVLRQALDLAPLNPMCSGLLAFALGRSGKREQARELLAHLLEERRERYYPAVPISQAFLGLGELEEALEWVETAFEEHEPLTTFLSVWPIFDPLRDQPRFQKILRKMGLESS